MRSCRPFWNISLCKTSLCLVGCFCLHFALCNMKGIMSVVINPTRFRSHLGMAACVSLVNLCSEVSGQG